MVVTWPAGVPHQFIRSTFQRIPEDVVRQGQPQYGPYLRDLRAASRYQTVRGQIACSNVQADTFEDWRKDELRYQREPFTLSLYDHPSVRNFTARIVGKPKISAPSRARRRIELEIRAEPPAPTAVYLSALAALDRASPASWPASVPGEPLVNSYASEVELRTRFANERNSPGAASPTRLEGATESVVLLMTSAELQSFETWFENDAALGARDILFPVGGGTHLGCFVGTYTVRGADQFDGWSVSFERYLEARA